MAASPRSALAVLIIAGVLLISGENVSAAARKCKLDDNTISGLVAQCGKYVAKEGTKVEPISKGCCGLVRGVDVPCLCSMITKEILEMVSMKKVVYVAQQCGKKLAPGTKCGGYTVPHA